MVVLVFFFFNFHSILRIYLPVMNAQSIALSCTLISFVLLVVLYTGTTNARLTYRLTTSSLRLRLLLYSQIHLMLLCR